MRRSEDYLQSILATAGSTIITINEHGAIDVFNRAAERMFAYTAAEVAGENVRLLMPPPYHDEHDGYLARYLRTGERHVIGIGREVMGLRRDGTTFPLDERRYMARERHDDIGGHMTGIGLLAQTRTASWQSPGLPSPSWI